MNKYNAESGTSTTGVNLMICPVVKGDKRREFTPLGASFNMLREVFKTEVRDELAGANSLNSHNFSGGRRVPGTSAPR